MPKVIVVGGGVAGLATAALLSKSGHETVLFEKMPQVGGRATVLEKDGFRLNFGAHAVYGRDQSFMMQVLNQLGINLSWATADAPKVRYLLPDGAVSTAPIYPMGMLQTKLLPGLKAKLDFLFAVLSIREAKNFNDDGKTLGEWMDAQSYSENARDFLIKLAGTNFFTAHPRELTKARYLKYYSRLFHSRFPVSYIQGGWGALTEALLGSFLASGGQLMEKTSVAKVLFENGRATGVLANKVEYPADAVVLCLPPAGLKRMLADTPLAESVAPYIAQAGNTVYVYDVALTKRVRDDISYVNDLEKHVFITDPSLYDSTCAPAGGQLLQGIAYMDPEDAEDEAKVAAIRAQVEQTYDRFYPGWRENLAFERVSECATVQGIGWRKDQLRLPIGFEGVGNCRFAGDWCEGEGSMSDVAFNSALRVAADLKQQLS